MTKELMSKLLLTALRYSFKFITYERPHRTVTYDIINNKFINIKKV